MCDSYPVRNTCAANLWASVFLLQDGEKFGT
jgi:hypothetical protein